MSATPTIVVLRDGREVARAVGGVGEDELDRLFDAASSGAATSAGARRAGTRTDVTLRLGAGASLLAAGLLAGGQPVLLLAGTCALAWAAAPCRAWRRAGAAPSAPESTR